MLSHVPVPLQVSSLTHCYPINCQGFKFVKDLLLSDNLAGDIHAVTCATCEGVQACAGQASPGDQGGRDLHAGK